MTEVYIVQTEGLNHVSGVFGTFEEAWEKAWCGEEVATWRIGEEEPERIDERTPNPK